MNAIVIVTVTILLAAAGPAVGQERGGLGGVLDTLGGLLGGQSKAHGTVVLARDTALVFRTDDGRTVRLDTASLDPDVRRQLVAGQAATITMRGSGDVVTATDVQVDQAKGQRTFSTVGGSVQERTADRIVFRTREGLTLPVDTSKIRGLPSFKPNDPATLIYEQGPRQEVVAVWVEPGDGAVAASPSASRPPADAPPSASLPSGEVTGRQTLEGLVESVEPSGFLLQISDGRRVDVETADRTVLEGVRPGDRVTVTGTPDANRGRFIAATVTRAR